MAHNVKDDAKVNSSGSTRYAFESEACNNSVSCIYQMITLFQIHCNH